MASGQASRGSTDRSQRCLAEMRTASGTLAREPGFLQEGIRRGEGFPLNTVIIKIL